MSTPWNVVLYLAFWLRKGEAGLPQIGLVNVSLLRTIDRERLATRLGTLGPDRIRQMLAGLALVLGLEPPD
jgi:mRNA-degrading endonuclease toxin of MazEF toxin-antitoxin module